MQTTAPANDLMYPCGLSRDDHRPGTDLPCELGGCPPYLTDDDIGMAIAAAQQVSCDARTILQQAATAIRMRGMAVTPRMDAGYPPAEGPLELRDAIGSDEPRDSIARQVAKAAVLRHIDHYGDWAELLNVVADEHIDPEQALLDWMTKDEYALDEEWAITRSPEEVLRILDRAGNTAGSDEWWPAWWALATLFVPDITLATAIRDAHHTTT